VALNLPARTLARPSFDAAFAAPAFVAAMLAFERALARAEEAEGLIPTGAAAAIETAAGALAVDVEALVAEGKRSASLAVPLARLLQERLAASPGGHERHAHHGATSQDAIDTAMALCLKPCLEEADRALEGVVRALAARAREHRATPMLGRTLLQPAVTITAGLKLARWASALAQDRDRLAEAAVVGLAVQLGGPVGDLATLGTKGAAVRHRVALELGLADARAWQSHRNAWIDLHGRIAQVVLTAGKIARDVALAAQPEVGEMREAPSGEGGRSSAMPHKRNPVACVHALAAATRVPGLLAIVHAAAVGEHERALGGWQAEIATVPEIAGALGASLDFLDAIASGLVVDPDRMRANVAAYAADAGPALDSGAAVDELLAELAPYL
jgi:3-carboxy-cis,cis-muconate cycloisomerase